MSFSSAVILLTFDTVDQKPNIQLQKPTTTNKQLNIFNFR